MENVECFWPNAQDQLQAALLEQNPSRRQDGAACQLYPLVLAPSWYALSSNR